FRLLTVRDQQRTVPVELSHQVLSVGVTESGKLFQLLHRAIPLLQRQSFVPDNPPQLPAGIGLILYLLRFVMPSQVSVLEGNIPQPYPFRLLNVGVLDLPKLFLLGQLFSFSG